MIGATRKPSAGEVQRAAELGRGERGDRLLDGEGDAHTSTAARTPNSRLLAISEAETSTANQRPSL